MTESQETQWIGHCRQQFSRPQKRPGEAQLPGLAQSPNTPPPNRQGVWWAGTKQPGVGHSPCPCRGATPFPCVVRRPSAWELALQGMLGPSQVLPPHWPGYGILAWGRRAMPHFRSHPSGFVTLLHSTPASKDCLHWGEKKSSSRVAPGVQGEPWLLGQMFRQTSSRAGDVICKALGSILQKQPLFSSRLWNVLLTCLIFIWFSLMVHGLFSSLHISLRHCYPSLRFKS